MSPLSVTSVRFLVSPGFQYCGNKLHNFCATWGDGSPRGRKQRFGVDAGREGGLLGNPAGFAKRWRVRITNKQIPRSRACLSEKATKATSLAAPKPDRFCARAERGRIRRACRILMRRPTGV